jgi:glycosyltransferase involved in cell wall biosynthesis
MERGDAGIALLTEFGSAQAGEMVPIASALVDLGAHERARDIARRLRSEGTPAEAMVFDAMVLNAEGRPDEARELAAHLANGSRYSAFAHARLLLELGDARAGWAVLAPNADEASTPLIVHFAAALFQLGDRTISLEAATIAAARGARGKAGREATRRKTVCENDLRLLYHGLDVDTGPTDLTYVGDPNVVFYLLHNSLPYMSGGYATRTHGLLCALRDRGRHMHGVTRPSFPYSQIDDWESVPERDVIDGIVYERLGERRLYDTHNFAQFCAEYVEALEPVARREQAAIMHGASSFWNGCAANVLKRRLAIPSVYEVRGLWELTRRSREPAYAATEAHAITVRLETLAAVEADAVIAITNALRNELMERGVDPHKIIVVPNGVDTERFVPRVRDERLEAQYGLAGKTVIGFVGTLVGYEGVDLLLRAADRLRRTRDDFHVLIVGRGLGENDLWKLSSELGLDDVVTFTGRVPHEQVERYLSVIDVTPFPRRAIPVCEMVSPLKPLESMATGKLVIASSVAALAEMVDDGRTGLLFEKESLDDLTRVLEVAIDDSTLRKQLTANARTWVEEQRSWSTLSGRVERLYEALLTGTPLDAGPDDTVHASPSDSVAGSGLLR